VGTPARAGGPAVNRQKPLAPGRVFGDYSAAASPDSATQTYELDLPRDARIRVRLRDGIGVQWEDVPSAPDRLVRRLTLKPVFLGDADTNAQSDPDVIFTSCPASGNHDTVPQRRSADPS
jgi:hypothetical protein